MNRTENKNSSDRSEIYRYDREQIVHKFEKISANAEDLSFSDQYKV